jgi:hypothetical protein
MAEKSMYENEAHPYETETSIMAKTRIKRNWDALKKRLIEVEMMQTLKKLRLYGRVHKSAQGVSAEPTNFEFSTNSYEVKTI